MVKSDEMQMAYKALSVVFFLVGIFFAAIGVNMLMGQMTGVTQSTGVGLIVLANSCFAIGLIGMLQVDVLSLKRK